MIVIDNFLPYPNVVRSWALSLQYFTDDELTSLTGHKNTWPGKRTHQIMDLDTEYGNAVLSKIAGLAINFFNINGSNLSIKSSFQLTTKSDGDSWIHVDNDVSVAGLLYLTPNAPLESGTSIYSNHPHQVVDTIGNLYNRLVLYRADKYHKSNNYFGENLLTGRLTQVFFIKEGE